MRNIIWQDKKRPLFGEAAEKVGKNNLKRNRELKNIFLIHDFSIFLNKKHKIYGYIYPTFCTFSFFNLIIRFILTKKSALAPWIVIPTFPQALAVS